MFANFLWLLDLPQHPSLLCLSRSPDSHRHVLSATWPGATFASFDETDRAYQVDKFDVVILFQDEQSEFFFTAPDTVVNGLRHLIYFNTRSGGQVVVVRQNGMWFRSVLSLPGVARRLLQMVRTRQHDRASHQGMTLKMRFFADLPFEQSRFFIPATLPSILCHQRSERDRTKFLNYKVKIFIAAIGLSAFFYPTEILVFRDEH